MRALLAAGAVALGLLVFAGIGAFLWVEGSIYGREPSAPEVEITVPKGASVKRVAEILAAEGLVSEPLALEIWLRVGPGVPPPKAGRHRVSRQMNVPELFKALAGRPLPEDVPVTLVEGWRLVDADAALAASGRIAPGAYMEAASSTVGYHLPFPIEGTSLAGYLLPDTYMVPPGPIDARSLVQRQVDAFAARFWEPHRTEIKKSGRSLRTLVIMASLLEREEPVPEIRSKVAGVLYNRLDANTPLGVDATSRFTLTDWSDRRAFLKKLRDPADPWNTRLKAGLPPGPIGAPSLTSLLAALRPEASDHWYYLHDKERRIHFSRTAAEHEAKRRKYDVW